MKPQVLTETSSSLEQQNFLTGQQGETTKLETLRVLTPEVFWGRKTP